MATLQTIRDKAGILVGIVIGLSLFAFILGDFLGQGNSGSDPVAGEIKGYEVSIKEYQAKVDEYVENTKRNNGNETIDNKAMESIYDQAWETLVSEYTMLDQYEKLGLNVSADELEDMIKGKYIDPQIQQIPIFQDQNTKQFDKTKVISFLKNLDRDESGVARASWLAFERGLVMNKIATKYNTLIQKGFLPNKLEIADQVKSSNESVDIEFIYKKYSEVKDEDVSFNDADLKKYYEDNLYKFKQNESRNITYLTFDVKPTQEDSDYAKAWLEKSKEDFESETNPVRYINLNSDEPYTESYFAQGELPANIDVFMFAADTGATTDVYEENGAFKIAKLISIKELPDSAEARHILLQASETMPVPQVIALSDSLQDLLKNGASFEELAMTYSQDKGSAVKGGDLGWFQKGQMVPTFQKACFEANKGDVVVAESQFGLHIIEVQNLGVKNKKINVGYLTTKIEASEQTDANVYNVASKFAGENRTKEQFDKAIEDQKLIPRVANNLKKSDRNIAGLENSRSLIRWAYNNELNTISQDIFKYADKYVVAIVTEIREKGTTPFELAKTELENYVIKDKKADLLMADFTQAKDDQLETMAKNLSLQVQKAEKVSFLSASIPGAGPELNAITQAMYSGPNTVISPIKGVNGVLAIKTSDKMITEKATEELEKGKLAREFANRVNYQAIGAIKENANIVDNRLNYY